MFVSARARVSDKQQSTIRFMVVMSQCACARVGNTTTIFGMNLSFVLNTYRGTCMYVCMHACMHVCM